MSVLLGLLCIINTGITVHAADNVAPYTPGTVVIPVEKTWDDNDNAAGLRPSSVTIKLYRYKENETYDESSPFKTAQITADSGWRAEFGLNDTGDGNDIIYVENGQYKTYKFAVKEDPVPSYTEIAPAHTDPNVVMTVDTGSWDRHEPNNDLEMDITTVGSTKNYIAIHGTQGKFYVWTPEELSLLEQHAIEAFCETKPGYGGETWGKTTFLTGFGYHSEVGFTVSGTHIKFDAHSNWAMWAAGEYTRSTIEQNTGKITNTVSTVDVTVTKAWDDGSDADGIRPGSLTLTLNGLPADMTAPEPTVTKDGDSWTYTWTGLPAANSTGTEIVYTVSENTMPDGYQAEPTTAGNGGTITNTHTPETTEVKITKVWDDAADQDGIRPGTAEFTRYLTLKADGETVSAVPTVKADETDPNKYIVVWEDLPKNKAGQPIEYTVEEAEITDYTPSAASISAGGTITNTHTPKTTEITVTKVWKDEDDTDGMRPDSLTLTVNGAPDGTEIPEPAVTKNGNTWTYTWTGLPKYSDGEEIKYTISEDSVPAGYQAEPTSVEDGGTITNTHTPGTTEIKVKKVWDDANDKDKKRPASITINLLADGKEIQEKAVTESDGWEVTFTELPVRKEGKKIVYTVTEDPIEEYTQSITGSADAGFTVTNTHKTNTPPTPTPTPSAPPSPPKRPHEYVPRTGDESHAWLWTGLTAAVIGLGAVIWLRKKYTA